MGFFDSLKRQAESTLKREVSQGINKAVNNAVQSVGKGKNHTETFTFASFSGISGSRFLREKPVYEFT